MKADDVFAATRIVEAVEAGVERWEMPSSAMPTRSG